MKKGEFRVVMECLRDEKLLNGEGLKIFDFLELVDRLEDGLNRIEKTERILNTVEEITNILRDLAEDEKKAVIEALST